MATETARGVLLPCPSCGEDQACIYLDLSDGAFHCRECDNDFTADDVRAFIARWQRVLSWVETLPVA